MLQTASPSAPRFALSHTGEGHKVLMDPCNILLPLPHNLNICPYRFKYVWKQHPHCAPHQGWKVCLQADLCCHCSLRPGISALRKGRTPENWPRNQHGSQRCWTSPTVSKGFWQFANWQYESLTLVHFRTHWIYQANSVLREGDLFKAL